MLYPKDPTLRIVREGETLVISWDWKRSYGLFCLAVGLIILVGMSLSSFLPDRYGNSRTIGDSVGLVAFMGVFYLPMIYAGLGFLLDRTVVRADKGSLSVWTGPVPMARNVRCSPDGITQIFLSRAVSSGSTTGLGQLYLLDGGAQVQYLAANFPSQFAAHQVRHELQDFYGLEDQPVYGQTTDPSHPGPRPGEV